MSKATEPHGPTGDESGDRANQSPKPTAPTAPTPAGYFSAPEPAPVFGPEPATAPAASPEQGVGTGTSDAQPTAGAPTAIPASSTTTAVRHPARVGTVVWGAVVLVLGILIILSTQLELHLNAGMTAMWLLFGAGVAMLVGGAINLFRKTRP